MLTSNRAIRKTLFGGKPPRVGVHLLSGNRGEPSKETRGPLGPTHLFGRIRKKVTQCTSTKRGFGTNHPGVLALTGPHSLGICWGGKDAKSGGFVVQTMK